MLEYGAIQIDVGPGIEMWVFLGIDPDDAIEKFKAAAAQELGPSQPFEIIRGIPTNYDRTKSIGWIEGHRQQHADPTGYVAEGGYYLVGKFITPQETHPTETTP